MRRPSAAPKVPLPLLLLALVLTPRSIIFIVSRLSSWCKTGALFTGMAIAIVAGVVGMDSAFPSDIVRLLIQFREGMICMTGME